jgi:hypothetical protein
MARRLELPGTGYPTGNDWLLPRRSIRLIQDRWLAIRSGTRVELPGSHEETFTEQFAAGLRFAQWLSASPQGWVT